MDWTPQQRALLDTISSTESPNYNVLYGGKTFGSYADHPRTAIPIASGPNVGQTSSAAGRYQFIAPTWDAQAKKLGLKDFSPQSQDLAAWDLAATTYKQKTGGDLQSALASGDPNVIANVGKALSGQWTSLPGGIESAGGTNKFVAAYNKAAGNPSAPGPNNGGSTGAPNSYAGGSTGGSQSGGGLYLMPVEEKPKGIIPKMIAAFGGDTSAMKGGIFGMLNRSGAFNNLG